MEFERLWRARKRTPARGALYVSSTAFVFATDDGVRAGFGAGSDLVAYELGLQSKDLTPPRERPVLGDEASIFFVADAFALGRGGMPGLAVLWRQGRVLGVLYVVGLRESTAKRVARSLARRQRMRIAKPTPVRPRVNDDREVALDDPGLRLPVYWLGRRFAPRHGLPQVTLDGSSRNVEPEEGFEMAATVSYLPRVVVAVDLPACFRGCWDPGSYSSFKGLAAVVRGLRPRRR